MKLLGRKKEEKKERGEGKGAKKYYIGYWRDYLYLPSYILICGTHYVQYTTWPSWEKFILKVLTVYKWIAER